MLATALSELEAVKSAWVVALLRTAFTRVLPVNSAGISASVNKPFLTSVTLPYLSTVTDLTTWLVFAESVLVTVISAKAALITLLAVPTTIPSPAAKEIGVALSSAS